MASKYSWSDGQLQSEDDPGVRPGFVYRAYDTDDQVLYVGSTVSVPARLGQHEATSEWYCLATRFTSEEYPDMRAARRMENEFIAFFDPPHNKMGGHEKACECNAKRCSRLRAIYWGRYADLFTAWAQNPPVKVSAATRTRLDAIFYQIRAANEDGPATDTETDDDAPPAEG